LLALPLFVLSGNLMSTGSIARRLLDLCDCLLGWLTGGLAMVCTVTCMFFAAISGSAVATTCAVGTFLIPRMTNRGYDKGFAGAITASAGSIGVIIPPSIPFVLYGCVAKVSIGDLFVAGFLPGIMMGAALMITSYFYCKKNGWKGEPGKYTAEDTWNCFKDAFWAILMPVIILGGIYSGIFTPTECAGVACVYCLVVSCFVYRDLDLKGVLKAMKDTVGIGCVALYLMGFSQVFANVLALERIPELLANAVLGITSNRILLLLIINVFLLIIGCFIDNIPATIILTPILLPIAKSAGVDPVSFGIIMTMNLAIGFITPPYGIDLFMAMQVGGIKMGEMLKPVLYMIGALLVVLLSITYIPALTLCFL
ncbi:MAG: TRAP transporter large permease, partial [Bacillota bacterium]